MVETVGIEPTTSCVQDKCSTNWATSPWRNKWGLNPRIILLNYSVSNRASLPIWVLFLLVKVEGLEPSHREILDPKSSASTNSATPSWWGERDLNPWTQWELIYSQLRLTKLRYLPLMVQVEGLEPSQPNG